MLDRSCVMLEYRLEMPCESWLTVVIRARPTAATISAYSTRSWPCSSFSNRRKSDFISSLTSYNICYFTQFGFESAPLGLHWFQRDYGRFAIQFRHQSQILQRFGVTLIITQRQ